ncbi:hypothetical protein MKZ38_005371 [Zalerion maritima]|uniref:CUE domain-containing protein n=1 Tax=Zalerion maritima TaxID=339359 RepID=A0AAD5S3Z4_9PEZI|nr:hypothetical protein MKZ38_005371 [Zalerion maritima]
MANDQLNLGPLILILVLSGLILRYLFVTSQPQPQRRDPQAAHRAREEATQRILQIFPRVDRRSILWDLQRTGGNVDATTERILTGRLATPPITFQPPPPPPGSSITTAASSQPGHGAKLVESSSQPDLITRYNLQNKLSSVTAAEQQQPAVVDKKGKVWSSNKDERQAALQKRREDMILAARRKMEAKLAAQKNAPT